MMYVKIISGSLVFILAVLSISASAQDHTSDLENRVSALENYVEGFQPTLNKFSSEMNNTISSYTQGLEKGMNQTYLKLQADLSEKLSSQKSRVVVLDTSGMKFQRIETDAGSFLISVDNIENTDKGYRVSLKIGNINFADYKDYKIKLMWGRKWTGNQDDSYAAWQKSLIGAEFRFQGTLMKGVWNPVKVDLEPASPGQVEYIECEMEVSSVMLDYK